MAIEQHPKLPFVEVGTAVDFAKRFGWDQQDDWHGTDGEWMFAIDGSVGSVVSWSADSALESAEEFLFVYAQEQLMRRVQRLRESGDVDLLMAVVELKGFWRGKLAAQAQVRELLKPAIDAISCVSKFA